MRKAFHRLGDGQQDVVMYLAFLSSSLGLMLVVSALYSVGGLLRIA
jgi:hypothetical protein